MYNVQIVVLIFEMVGGISFEFQCLYGMGEWLYDIVLCEIKGCCCIYVLVGVYCDLLVYLVCCLLENGVNSSFVNQIVDEFIIFEEVVCDLFEVLVEVWFFVLLLVFVVFYGDEWCNLMGFDILDEQVLVGIMVVWE